MTFSAFLVALVPLLPIISAQEQSPYTLTTQAMQGFPDWLKEFTGLNEWPGLDPPYIPLDYIDFDRIPPIPQYKLTECNDVETSWCSFHCNYCAASDEIASCPLMSQTFDDGPSPATSKLLDSLTARTTFFTLGLNIVRFPDTFRRQKTDGHLLASHTWSHADLPSLSNEKIIAQIQWSIWAMNATAGIIPRYFRSPYGSTDNRVRAIARQFGLVSVLWNKDTFDWKINSGEKAENQVFEDVRRWRYEGGGGLILEHDSTIRTVNAAIEVSKILGAHQMTAADCVGGKWYQ